MESNLEFMPRQRRSSLDSQANSELGSRQRREPRNSSDINHHWRQFLQRNREFASNKEKAKQAKAKAKQEELDKACTFAPKVHDWSLKTQEGTESDGKTCVTQTLTSCNEVVHPEAEPGLPGDSQQEIALSATANESKHDNMERQVPSIGIHLDGPPQNAADSSENDVAAADSSGLRYTDTNIELAANASNVEAITHHQVSEKLLASKLPLEAWKEQEDGVAGAQSTQEPPRLTCSPSAKLIVSDLASEAALHDTWPRARLLFVDCDDLCGKRLSNVSATASTEVSNCPSEAGAENDDDDDLDTLVANLRSHKVYSFHFSG